MQGLVGAAQILCFWQYKRDKLWRYIFFHKFDHYPLPSCRHIPYMFLMCNFSNIPDENRRYWVTFRSTILNISHSAHAIRAHKMPAPKPVRLTCSTVLNFWYHPTTHLNKSSIQRCNFTTLPHLNNTFKMKRNWCNIMELQHVLQYEALSSCTNPQRHRCKNVPQSILHLDEGIEASESAIGKWCHVYRSGVEVRDQKVLWMRRFGLVVAKGEMVEVELAV